MAKLLLIEDDLELAQMIAVWLRGEQHVVSVSHDGQEGYEMLLATDYDLAIVDWNLPGKEGVDICLNYRGKRGATPILMLTGRSQIEEKLTGFGAGADDYLTKPFHMKELSSRVRALLRRGHHVEEEVLQSNGILLTPSKFSVVKDGKTISLLPKEFALLEFFMRNPDAVLTPETLFQHVWKSDSESSEMAIRTCIKRLRKKIDGPDGESVIETVPRIGYRLRG
ncbi:MAG: response regulator transcription factor [Cyanobacteria bacterium SZAS LIN-2]|nr:response regulator transcription factor [Cyanobacteria bacterium SZAS LIN-3]MBS1997177.1 response regulator transcription factor [Cyanobacteria bacterium SZAS LIN-2]MBS2008905.1 response regulator transcription factor [Cyanobacteria bacterium SZAS TMP-1]